MEIIRVLSGEWQNLGKGHKGMKSCNKTKENRNYIKKICGNKYY